MARMILMMSLQVKGILGDLFIFFRKMDGWMCYGSKVVDVNVTYI